jgi:hypothetical protein
MTRFGFNLKTRSGQRVENISIMAPTQADAERRLRQMYLRCEILDCHHTAVPQRIDTLDVEAVIGLISRSEPPPPAVAATRERAPVLRLRRKAGTH